jgi:hypothetical protein
MFNTLIKKNIVRPFSFQLIRGFKRQIVPSDFDVEHHKNKIEKNNKNDPIPYFMEQIKKKEKLDIENEKWCTDNQENELNERED